MTHLLGWYLRTLPVEEIVMEVSISHTKLQVFQDSLVLSDIQGIEHICTKLDRGREGGREGV